MYVFFFQAEDGIRDRNVTGVQTCALPISGSVGHQASWDVAELTGGMVPASDLRISRQPHVGHRNLTQSSGAPGVCIRERSGRGGAEAGPITFGRFLYISLL